MGQYEAGVHAQNILRKVMNRSDMGSVVNESNGKWINGRKKIGSYNMNLLENVDYNDPENEYKFELGFNNFINTLNEHYHVDGYYIDSDGKVSGDIYVCEEAEDSEVYVVNPLTDDIAYIQQEAVWQDYLVNKARLENRLRTAVSEALVLSDERIVNKVDSILAIHEGISDTLSDGWTKFKNFLAKLWQKFTEFISRTLNNDKGYLTKYKEIILHREVKLDEVTFDANYSMGERNITQFTIYVPTSADIDALPAKNEGDNIKTVQDKLFSPYAGNHSYEFVDYCTRWFKGNTDEYPVSSSGLNMASMFNWCYNFDKIEKKINKDRTTFDTAFRNFETKAKDIENKQKAIDQATKVKNDTVGYGSNKSGDLNDIDKEIQDAQDSITNQGSGLDKKIKEKQEEIKKITEPAQKKTEEDELKTLQQQKQAAEQKIRDLKLQKQRKETTVPSKTSITPQNASYVMTTLGLQLMSETTIGKSKTGGTSSGGSNPGNLNLGNSAVKMKDVGDDGSLANASDLDALKERLNMYCTTSQQIFASLLSAAQKINKDYMMVIKAHVQSYAGNMEDSTRIAGTAAANHSQEIKFDPGQVAEFKQTIVTIKQMQAGPDQDAAITNLLQRATNATAAEEGKPRKSFASLQDLESFLAGHPQPAANP